MYYLLIALTLFVGFLIYAFPLARVYEDSMLPTLHNGDIIVCSRFFNFDVSGVYVFTSADGEHYVIKRLTEIKGNSLYFLGDNPPKSWDSRDYGYIDKKRVRFKAIFNLRKGASL
jgi:phage repressor protein C with HTH and peptisase S24 domain